MNDSLFPASFMDTHWRRSPLLMRGAAHSLLPECPSRSDITAYVESGKPATSDGSTIWFVQAITDGLPGLVQLTRRARDYFEWQDIWCDVFLTCGPSSIGSHYDDSDNFTIQLEGEKTWRLHPPSCLPAEERRLRLLGEPGIGSARVPQDSPDAVEFTVRAKDVLYIPSLWLHWGISQGDSTSVSLVVNVATPYHALREQLLRALRESPAWHEPLPVGPGSHAARIARLRDLTRPGEFPESVHERVEPRIEARSGTQEALRPRQAVVDLDRQRLQAYIASAPAAPDGEFDWLSAGEGHASLLTALLARRNVKTLLKLIIERHRATTDTEAQRLYESIAVSLLQAEDKELDLTLTDPEVAAWISAAGGAPRELPALRAEDPLASSLGLLLLPELLAAHGRPPLILTMAESSPHAVLMVHEGNCTVLTADGRRTPAARPVRRRCGVEFDAVFDVMDVADPDLGSAMRLSSRWATASGGSDLGDGLSSAARALIAGHARYLASAAMDLFPLGRSTDPQQPRIRATTFHACYAAFLELAAVSRLSSTAPELTDSALATDVTRLARRKLADLQREISATSPSDFAVNLAAAMSVRCDTALWGSDGIEE